MKRLSPLPRGFRTAGFAAALGLLAAGGGSALAEESRAPVGGSSAQATTSRPDLVSATVLNQGLQRTVRYCFDAVLSDNPNTVNQGGNQFFLTGYDINDVVATANPGDARFDTDAGGGRCVLVLFPAPVDVAAYTIAVASQGAVAEQGSGRQSFRTAAALEGSTVTTGPGNVSGPNLVEVLRNATLNQVTYRFDRILTASGNAGEPVATRFGFFTSTNQQERRGQSIVQVSGRDVTVQFGGGVQPVGEGVRFFADAGAVTSVRQSDPNGTDVLGLGTAPPGVTTRPDLQSAAKVTGTASQYDLAYDLPVIPGNPAQCGAFTEDGNFSAATAINASGSSTTIRVTFATVAQFDAKVVKIGDFGGCAVEREQPAAPSSVGEGAARAANKAPGFTDGPDLLSCAIEPGSSAVLFRFDQEIDPGSGNAGRYFIFDTDGNRVAGGTGAIVGAGGTGVLVQYTSSQAQSAVGCAIEGAQGALPAAIRDRQGKSNSEATQALAQSGQATSGTTTGTSGTTTGTSGTTTGTSGTTTGTSGGTTSGTTTGTTTATSGTTTGTSTTSGAATTTGAATGGPSTAGGTTTTTTTTTTTGTDATTAGPAGAPTTTGAVRDRLDIEAISLRGSASRRGRTFVIDLSGAVVPEADVPCGGVVSARLRAGRRTVASRFARVGANCRFRIRVSLSARRVPARVRTLNVLTRFSGTATLKPARGGTDFVALPRRR